MAIKHFMSGSLVNLICDVIEDKLGEDAAMTYYEYTEDRDYMCWIAPDEKNEGTYYACTDADDEGVAFKSKGRNEEAVEKDAVKDPKVKKYFKDHALKWVKDNKDRFDESVNESGDKIPVVSQVYVRRGSKREDYEDFVIVNEIDNGKVSFSNPFNDWFELSVEAFNKKYVKGNRSDYDMFEEGQDIQLVEVSGKEYPVVSQGRDAYICLDEEGNKFKVGKNSLNEASSKAGDSYVADLLKKDMGSLRVGDFENIPDDVGRGSLRKLADSLAKYMFAKFQGSKIGSYYGNGISVSEVVYDSKNRISFYNYCLTRASVEGEISFSTKIKGRNKDYKLPLSGNTTMEYIRGFIENVALNSYDKAVSND